MSKTIFTGICTWTAAVLLSVFLFGCEKPSSGRGSIQGTVRQSTTGEVIQGIHVQYANIDIVTDANGHYAMDTIPEGLQGFTFYASGYKTQVSQVVIPRGNEIINDISMDVISVGWCVGMSELSYGSIFYTTNGGANWKRQGTINTIPDVTLRGVCAVDTNVCWVVGDALGARMTLLRSDDAGATWTRTIDTLDGGMARSLSAISAVDADSAWAVCYDAGVVLKTTNKGNGWTVCCDTSSAVAGFDAVTTPDGVNIWCCGRSAYGGPVIYYSPDGGKNWESQPVPGSVSSASAVFDIKALSAEELYAVGSSGIGGIKSTDSGSSWHAVSFDAPSTDLTGVCVIGPKCWFSGLSGCVIYSYDDFATGGTAGVVPSSLASNTFTKVSFIGDGTSGAATMCSPVTGSEGGVAVTYDGGRNWALATVPYRTQMYSISFAGASK